jgi:arginyl-tRNA synthetase
MKEHIERLIAETVAAMKRAGTLAADLEAAFTVERTRDKRHGDFATNAAMVLAKAARTNPRQLAEQMLAALRLPDDLERAEIAGPGFINFFQKADAAHRVVTHVLQQGEQYGRSQYGAGKHIQVEFVSANPTGPLHVGHGRGAAYGAAVADLLEAVGYNVHREYYVNDAGRQMDILATSVWLRYLEHNGIELVFPSNGYKGHYVREIAAELEGELGAAYVSPAAELFRDIPLDEPQGGDKEKHIDALIERAKKLLGDNRYRYIFELGLNTILDDIRDDLAEFGVKYEQWYSERSLSERGLVNKGVERLRAAGHLYEKEGAIWFRSSAFGDEKDRVVIRENGQTTYFASDIAYHMDKIDRGFDGVIDIWGADHHGYVPRIKGALTASSLDASKLDVLLVQFAILYRGTERVQMSTRSGEFVTLRELRAEVGNDAARFFYVMRKCEQHLDFDLDLAKSQSSDNPVYYIQYAHARICTLFDKLQERGLSWDQAHGLTQLAKLEAAPEQALMTALASYPDLVQRAALAHEPHQIAQFLRDLAAEFHGYYNSYRFLDGDDAALRNARLCLASAIHQVLRNGLTLLGVSAPQSM